MKPGRLSIIFVNWNSTRYLRECIASIYEWTLNVEFELVVVDNASPDADVDAIHEEFNDVILIKSQDNLGFARANNLGLKGSTGEYILFLNPDTKLVSPAIDIMMVQLGSLSDAGAVGCRLLNGDLSVQTSCIQTFPTIPNQALDTDFFRKLWPGSHLWGVAPLFSSRPEPARVEVISGACLFIKREVFESVGMFTEDYFMYAEDLDLCYKVSHAGYRNYYIGAAAVIHYGGKSSNPRSAIVRKWKSILHFCVRNYGQAYAFRFRVVMVFVALVRLFLLALARLIPTRSRPSADTFSTSAKWSAVLRTLLSAAH